MQVKEEDIREKYPWDYKTLCQNYQNAISISNKVEPFMKSENRSKMIKITAGFAFSTLIDLRDKIRNFTNPVLLLPLIVITGAATTPPA
jgi:hypothetical protein